MLLRTVEPSLYNSTGAWATPSSTACAWPFQMARVLRLLEPGGTRAWHRSHILTSVARRATITSSDEHCASAPLTQSQCIDVLQQWQAGSSTLQAKHQSIDHDVCFTRTSALNKCLQDLWPCAYSKLVDPWGFWVT